MKKIFLYKWKKSNSPENNRKLIKLINKKKFQEFAMKFHEFSRNFYEKIRIEFFIQNQKI
jgi:hypothetical protein